MCSIWSLVSSSLFKGHAASILCTMAHVSKKRKYEREYCNKEVSKYLHYSQFFNPTTKLWEQEKESALGSSLQALHQAQLNLVMMLLRT